MVKGLLSVVSESSVRLCDGGPPTVDAFGDLLPAMPPLPHEEYQSRAVRERGRRDRALRRAGYRARWWFPAFILLIGLSGCWGLLKADQFVADTLIWPTKGAQFVEVGPLPADPAETGDRLMIVVGGVNRKSGTGAAAALMPSLTVGNTRVVSLVYGSGINSKDIQEKFDALLDQYQPREVSFFGSSMGGDIALSLAAHLEQGRADYRQSLLTELTSADGASAGSTQSQPGTPGVDASGQPSTAAGDRTPAERDRTPANGDQTPASGDPTPAERNRTPANGDPTPASGDPMPAERNRTPANGDQTPASGDPTPPEGDRTPGGQAAAVVRVLITADSAASTTLGRAGVAALASRAAVPVDPRAAANPVPPRLGTIFLDCSPLAVDDVRDVGRTQADALTALTEALHTDGGVAVRLTAEVLTQQGQWSTGRFPFLQVRPDDLLFKIRQVWREKIDAPGISTQLIKDQYGVIRRMDIGDVVDELGPGTRIVYFRPVDPTDDHTVRVDRVESTLRTLAIAHGLNVHFVGIPGGQHASAESDSDLYRHAIDVITGSGP